MMTANIILFIATAYTAIGAIFALLFITKGLSTIDPTAHHAPLGFRLIILPGSIALWPILLKRWIVAAQRIKTP